MPSPPQEDGELKILALEVLIPTPDNPRVLREDDAFRELVESIKALGVLQPVIARPFTRDPTMPAAKPREKCEHWWGDPALQTAWRNGQPLYDLRAGHRRLIAARAAGLARMPVIVREMDDKTAMEITVTENLQRANLHPLEESQAIQGLLDVGWELAAIADRLGKPPGWVARRAKLRELSPNWRKITADDGNPLSRWPATLLERIARLGAAQQDQVLEELRQGEELPAEWERRGVPTEAMLNAWLASEILGTLHGAPWKIDDATLLPEAGACSACPKRSSRQPLLFDDLPDQRQGRRGARPPDCCLDRQCWSHKLLAHARAKWHQVSADYPNALLLADGPNPALDLAQIGVPAARIGDPWEFGRARKNEPGMVPALTLDRRGIARLQWVRPYSYSPRDAGGTAGRPKAKPASQVRALRRKALVLRSMHESFSSPPAELLKALRRNGGAIALAGIFGTSYEVRVDRAEGAAAWQKRLADRRNVSESERALALLRLVAPQMARLVYANTHDLVAEAWRHAQPLCALAGLDLAGLERRALEKIPEPGGKSWPKKAAKANPKKIVGLRVRKALREFWQGAPA